MKNRPPVATAAPRLTPLPSPPTPLVVDDDDRCESLEATYPIAIAVAAAAARSPPKRYPRLQTLASLAHDHVLSMHTGAFVARSRERWQTQETSESDRTRAYRVRRESAALVVQSAWRRWVAVRLRARLVRAVWQQQMELAAWLSRDREELQRTVDILTSHTPWPLTAARHGFVLHGAFVRLPALLLATWLCFTLGHRRRSRFLRRPAPAILHAVHIPVRTTVRLCGRLWREATQLAARTIQCRARAFLARCTYWRLVLVHRRARAAVQLQSLYRAWVARRLVWRLRRRRAAIRIQCVWRCVRARRLVQLQRVSRIATRLVTNVTRCAVANAVVKTVEHAARQIQRMFRGQRARAQFRVLVARRDEQQWHRNPSRGYRLFAERHYFQAAVYLERCFRQDIFQDDGRGQEDEIERPRSRDRGVEPPRRRLVPSGSRLNYSFSDAPTPLDPDPGSHRLPNARRPASPSHDPPSSLPVACGTRHCDCAVVPRALHVQQLAFWETYALSHWFSFQSNGDVLHLRQARVGFETFLRLGAVPTPTRYRSSADDTKFQFLCLHARVCLVFCVYWSRKPKGDDDEQALLLCVETLDELEMLSGLTTADMVHQASLWRAQLLMISASLHLIEDPDACCIQLRTLLDMTQRGECAAYYDETDLRFLLAVVLLATQKDPTDEAAEDLLKRCYQDVELWPGVGFYHGEQSSSDAAVRLQDEPVGSFLLHHDVVHGCRKLLLKVKLSNDPCKVSSLRIHNEDGVYHMKKLPNCSHFSVHELIQQLPPAAGVRWCFGVRRRFFVPALEKVLPDDHKKRLARRAALLPWDQWRWRVSSSSARHNECWGSLCQVFATRLEASEAHEMAALVARDGLRVARDRALRAELFFTMGRVSFQLQRRIETTLALKHASIESARLREPFNSNFGAITRAFSRAGTLSHSFMNELERVAKLERMCVKAWSFDSCSPTLRGHPFCEALLLQRVDDEVTHDCVADTLFLRALLRAHTTAFLTRGVCETTHVTLAFACVRRLFERFQQVHDDANSVLHRCTRHLRTALHHSEHSIVPAAVPGFSFSTLLLTWHRIPFQVAFEMAEVLYRLPTMTCATLVDAYESLYGRLRSVKPRNWAYAAYEELLLVRVAFLYAQRASEATDETTPGLLARKSVEVMDELIGLRRLRALGSHLTVSVKRIQWPTRSLQLPSRFSLHELLFMRGFLWEQVSRADGTPNATAQSNAWRDFDGLHQELLAVVVREQAEEQQMARRQKQLKVVRVFVGDTMDVGVTDMLHSKPFVSIQCEKHHVTTQQPASWMNQLSPGWNEFVEVDVTSSKTRLVVTVMNRSTRLRRRNLHRDQSLGYVQIHVEELLTSHHHPEWYDLICRDADSSVRVKRDGARPRIRLGFQLMMQAAPVHTAPTARVRRIRGHWDADELRRHLRGDVRRFVGSPWIWRWYARQWLADKDFSIAAWFLQRAIAMDEEVHAVAHALDVVDLATCYRATMGSTWLEYAQSMLEDALTTIQAAYDTSGASDLALAKHIDAIANMLGHGRDSQTPLAEELAKRTPASSHWIAMETHHRRENVYYFNEDTCERFDGVASEPHVRTPLEWETNSDEVIRRDPLRPRRVVVLTADMKARVKWHCDQQRARYARDPHQWLAVFNQRKQVMQFLSLTPETLAVNMTTVQPLTYAMLADDHLMYHVLIVQDAFRAFQRRRQRQRRLRGLLFSAYVFVRERRAAELRLADRAETARKRQLNCLHVFIERASKLRAMDLFTSDPFVVLELIDADGDVVAKGQTSVRRNTLHPQWHEEFRLHCAFVDDEAAQSRLRFRVYDRDLVHTHAQEDDDSIDQEDEQEDQSDNAAKRPRHDFLGLAETAIEPLVHGKCVTADFELRDEDGAEPENDRGTLTITVQWIHDPDSDPKNWTMMRRNAVKPMILVRPRKRKRPKPTLTSTTRELVSAVIAARAVVLERMGDLGVLLDQLVRLFKRWRVAKASGRTADEAKLMEQRLRAATAAPQPFHAKFTDLVASVETARAAIETVLKNIDAPIRDWLESCDKASGETLTTILTTALTSIRDAGNNTGVAASTDTNTFAEQFDRVLSLRRAVVVWRQELLVLLTTFFEPPVPIWDEPVGTHATLEQFAQTHAMLHDETTTTTSRPAAAKSTASTTTTTINSPAPEVQPPTRATQPNAAVAKRMERIERERRKANKKL